MADLDLKIISGGQTGVGRSALDWAMVRHHAVGSAPFLQHCPKSSGSGRAFQGICRSTPQKPRQGDCVGGDGDDADFGINFPHLTTNANVLWFQLANLYDATVYANVYNATDQVYAIWLLPMCFGNKRRPQLCAET